MEQRHTIRRPRAALTALSIVLWLSLSCALADTPPAAPLSVEEGRAFGNEIEHQATADGSLAFYFNAYDWGLLFDCIQPRSASQRATFQKIRGNLIKGFDAGFREQAAQISQVKVLHVRQADGKPTALLRLILANHSVAYYDLVLARGTNGTVRIADAYIYASGEKLSDTVRRMVVPFIESENRTALGRLLLGESDLVKHESEWSRLPQLNAEGRYEEALKIYHRLPESLQKEKFILAQRLKAAQKSDEKEYQSGVDLWTKTYPGDPALDLISIDACMLRKDYAGALRHVDRLNAALGGDPFLDVQRALIFARIDDPARAAEAACRAVDAEPTLLDAGRLALNLLAQAGLFERCIEVLDKLESAGGFSRQQLKGLVESSDKTRVFVRSDAYHTWLGTHDGSIVLSGAGNLSARQLKLQSVIYKPDGGSASIGGKIVMVGDEIAHYRVLTIEPQSVTVESPTGQRKTVLLGGALE